MGTNSTYTAKMVVLVILVLLSVTLCQYAKAGGYNPPPPPPPTPPATVVNNYSVIPVGVALAGASGSCVKDWKPGWQKCVFWGMVDVDTDSGDDTVHAFGAGLTTRVDQFAIHINAGFENFNTDEEAIMFSGSINWR